MGFKGGRLIVSQLSMSTYVNWLGNNAQSKLVIKKWNTVINILFKTTRIYKIMCKAHKQLIWGLQL